ncbi:PROTEIN RALF-LIKE 27-RELATED [Salix viminalis]|uniref:PROTEIN RALF-LIKE 27-RELATED n=1 Tax=Salix viminalis TaxID=40686 RepID=A0A9Q0SPC9_SALVM|nr:PROTEIN RALF-LIKE 27-RELATED [Salix viminalis]
MRPKLSVEFLWRLSLTILLVSAITSTSTAAVLKRNSSPIFATIGEGNEEEFSMDSEVHQRLIASQGQFIAYRSLEQQPVCNAQIYGNCVKPINPGSRPCTYYNRCKRAV